MGVWDGVFIQMTVAPVVSWVLAGLQQPQCKLCVSFIVAYALLSPPTPSLYPGTAALPTLLGVLVTLLNHIMNPKFTTPCRAKSTEALPAFPDHDAAYRIN